MRIFKALGLTMLALYSGSALPRGGSKPRSNAVLENPNFRKMSEVTLQRFPLICELLELNEHRLEAKFKVSTLRPGAKAKPLDVEAKEPLPKDSWPKTTLSKTENQFRLASIYQEIMSYRPQALVGPVAALAHLMVFERYLQEYQSLGETSLGDLKSMLKDQVKKDRGGFLTALFESDEFVQVLLQAKAIPNSPFMSAYVIDFQVIDELNAMSPGLEIIDRLGAVLNGFKSNLTREHGVPVFMTSDPTRERRPLSAGLLNALAENLPAEKSGMSINDACFELMALFSWVDQAKLAIPDPELDIRFFNMRFDGLSKSPPTRFEAISIQMIWTAAASSAFAAATEKQFQCLKARNSFETSRERRGGGFSDHADTFFDFGRGKGIRFTGAVPSMKNRFRWLTDWNFE
jgi:hypothetical protein